MTLHPPTSVKHGYLPFGYGSRTCIGNHLALIEGTVMIALLMQKYRFLPAEGFKPDLVAGISLVSRNGVEVRVEREAKGGGAAKGAGERGAPGGEARADGAGGTEREAAAVAGGERCDASP